jgi:hypothetical protein
MDLPGKLTHDHARFGKCGFSLGLKVWEVLNLSLSSGKTSSADL